MKQSCTRFGSNLTLTYVYQVNHYFCVVVTAFLPRVRCYLVMWAKRLFWRKGRVFIIVMHDLYHTNIKYAITCN